MICPECGSQKVYIRETRGNDTRTVERRRVCEDCRLGFWTYEVIYPDLRRPKLKEHRT